MRKTLLELKEIVRDFQVMSDQEIVNALKYAPKQKECRQCTGSGEVSMTELRSHDVSIAGDMLTVPIAGHTHNFRTTCPTCKGAGYLP